MSSRSLRRWATAGFAVVAFLVVLIRVLPDPAPESDFAFLDLKVISVTEHLDPTGAYSRFGWSHPGPLYFQLLAPLYYLSGLKHLAILAGVALINLACIVAMLVAFKRFGRGIWLMLSAALLLGVHVYRAPDLLASPWNAHTPLLPLSLLIVLCAAIWAGRIWALPLAVAVASLVIQAHVGPSLAVLAVLAVSAGCVVVAALRARGADDRAVSTPPVAALAVSVVVGLVLWALPFADAIAPHGQHNLERIYTSLGRDHIPPRVADRAFAYYFIAPLSPELGLPWGAPLRAGRDVDWRGTAQIVAGLQALVLIVSLVRKQRFEAGYAIMLLVASAAAWYSARQLPEDPLNHTLYWIVPLGILTWAAAVGTLVSLLMSRVTTSPRVDRALLWSLAVFSVIAGIASTVIWYQRFILWSPKVETASKIVRDRLNKEPGKEPFFEIVQTQWALPPGVILQLIKTGSHPAVNAERLAMFGPSFARDPRRRYLELHLVVDPEHSDDLAYRSNYALLGAVEDTYVYTVEPAPASSVGPTPRVASVGTGISNGELVVDGQIPDGSNNSRITVFETPGSSLSVSTIPNVIGVRLWGQGATDWLMGCVHEDGKTTPMGQVHIAVGDGAQSGDAFLKGVETCRAVTVTPPGNNAGMWLSEIQLLVRRPGL